MGPVVTINTATMVNKGLEVIEAHELFGTSYDDIEVMVHPQSVIQRRTPCEQLQALPS